MRNRNVGVVPDKRTLVVLGALIVSMTVTSGVLLALEPGPVSSLSEVSLTSIDQSSRQKSWNGLFDTATPRHWQAIVIHDSGTATGSASTLDAQARKKGLGGLGYDFVVNNGSDRADGLIEVGYRWRQQKPGAYVVGHSRQAKWCDDRAVGVCMIGNGDRGGFTQAQLHQLVSLVQRLQRRYDIPKDMVFVDIGHGNNDGAVAFPRVWFREQLLAASDG